MELNYLKDFVTLARIHHFQEAADALFISQSALSKHIKAIEAELGQELFIRSRKRSELSDFGKLFLPYALKMLEIQQEYTALLPRPDKYVAFGYIPMVTLYNFMNYFTTFLQKSPSYQYSLVQGDPERLVGLLRRGSVEFILTCDIPSLPEEEYEKILYTQDRLVVILPEDHRLAACKNVSVEDLEKENLIAFSANVYAENYLEQLYPNANFQVAISVEKDALLLELVQQKFGVSVMTFWAAAKLSQKGIVVKDIYPASRLEFYMIYQKNRNVSSLTRSFAEYLKKRNEGEHPTARLGAP